MHVVADAQDNGVARATASPQTAGLKVGDEVYLVMKSGTTRKMDLVKIEPGVLSGTSDGKAVEVSVDQIERIEQRKVSSDKTTGFVVGVVVAVVAAAAILLSNVSHNSKLTNSSSK